ncbi:MAG: SUMF1/EgtB/PvdO family nonheme iron enzyme [Bryobacteraceae bacterium]|nr:SUMF1/EgtB/PvdO family nonheme iron enzyme [Bryobacteraceae bacterium]
MKRPRGTAPPAGTEYPWGDEFDPAQCNTREDGPGRTTPVGAYPDGISPYGCYDMAGNVWQWTSSRYSAETDWIVLRGGSWSYYRSYAASSYRISNSPHFRGMIVGFRCARTPP